MISVQRIGALLLAGFLGGCSSDGNTAFEALGPLAKDAIFGEDEPPVPTPELTRAQLAQVPFATIAISVPDQPRSFVAAVANNQGFVTYQDQARRTVVFEGGLLVATGGLGYNLSAIKHQSDDPVAAQTPVSGWPERIVRNYQFALKSAANFEITVWCSYTPVVRERIEIVELFFDTIRIEERCQNGKRTFTNTYWAEEDTGFIWKSVQWIGPRQPDPFTIEIIRPIG